MNVYNEKKAAPRVDTEEEIDRAPSSVLFESLIEPLISWIGRAPYFVFERLLYVVFSVRLDHKIASLRGKSENKVKDRVSGLRTNAGRVSKFWGL